MTDFTVGSVVHGYEVKSVEWIDDLKINFIRLKHLKTGAEHIHLANHDSNNVFSVTFKTTPTDSTGVAHILEHTALCASHKFPIRDPFFTMVRRSLNTFMNAFTSSDWTMFPFASQNEQDFYNLMDVYLNSAFFPKLLREDFMQEGHRFEFSEKENMESELTISGVVYNEMKGNMSQPSSVVYRDINKALYPTITYGNNSGGEPSDIPNLTYEQFVNFHHTHYHPSNAYFFTYGSFALEKHLEFIDREILSKFDSIDVHTVVPDEKRYTEPKNFDFVYALNAEEDDGAKTYVNLSWLTNHTFNTIDSISMMLLGELLLGHAGAPLNKALMESGLGSKLAPGTGYNDEPRETTFGVGLEGVKTADVLKVEELILSTLKKIARDGFSDEEIKSAIHQYEFATKEITGSDYPYGLNLLFRMTGSWFHGGEPLAALNLSKNLDELKTLIKGGRYFEGLIEKYLINNPHRVRVVVSPDHNLQNREVQELKEKLERYKQSLTREEKQKIIDDSMSLVKRQNAEEDLSCLPQLTKDALTREVPKIMPRPNVDQIGEVQYTTYEKATNGIAYLRMNFSLTDLSVEEIELLSILDIVMTSCGADGLTYDQMSELCNLYTGGIYSTIAATSKLNEEDHPVVRFGLSAKALNENIAQMVELTFKYILKFDLSDAKRMETVLKRSLASLESRVLDSGHRYAMNRAASGWTVLNRVNEKLSGIEYIKHLSEVVKNLDAAKLVDDLTAIGRKIFARDNLDIVAVGDLNAIRVLKSELAKHIDELPDMTSIASQKLNLGTGKLMEALTTTTPVSYVAHSFKVPNMESDEAGALFLLQEFLRSFYLHPEIREKGGAYGGGASYQYRSGIFNLYSYRDPNFKRTEDVYDGAIKFLDEAKDKFTQADIDELIIARFGALDTPSSPYSDCMTDYAHLRNGISFAIQQKFRDAVFNVTLDQIIAVGKKYLCNDYAVCAITSKEILERDDIKRLEVRNF